MEENREKEWQDTDIKVSSPFLSRLDNFWYHYKWHTIVGVFILAVILIFSLQMCEKKSYDTYVLYATGTELNRGSTDGTVPEYNEAVTSLEKLIGDYNGDGERVVSLITLYTPSEEELKASLGEDGTKEINSSLISSDREALRERMLYSEYYLLFISPSVYEEYKKIDELEIFAPISSYVPEGKKPEYYSDRAIKLSSLDIYSLPGICEMPADTLVCLRLSSVVADAFGGEKNAEIFKRAEKALVAILSYSEN